MTPIEIPTPTPIEAPFDSEEWETVALEGDDGGVVWDIGDNVEVIVGELVGRSTEVVSVSNEVIWNQKRRVRR